MKLYGAIDLHSTNNVTVVIDEQDRVVYQKRLPNDLALILKELSVYQSELQGIVVESTYNWYWLVDGLMEQGYRVHLANTAAIQQYEGFKYTDDHSDARWLAHLLRLDVLPEGYIYPRAERAVRDLLRKRSQMVRQRTTNLLSIQNLLTRNTGSSLSANRVKGLDVQQVDELLPNRISPWRVKANLSVMSSADQQSRTAGTNRHTTSQASCAVQLSQDGAWDRRDSGVDHHAGDRRHWEILQCGKLRFVLPLCRQPEDQQRQEKRPGQHQERQ